MFKSILSILLLMSFFSGNLNYNFSYYNLEDEIRNETIFIESGIKAQYKTKLNIEDELKRIEKIFKDTKILYKDKSEIRILIRKDYDINIKLWNENKSVYVEVIVINKNKDILIRDIEREIKKLNFNKSTDFNIFKMYNGKSKNKDMLKFVEKENLLKIQNGYTGKLELKDGEQANFSVVEYDTGVHIIIGTPVIFTTY